MKFPLAIATRSNLARFLKIQGANSSNIRRITEMLEQYFLLTERSQGMSLYLQVPFVINPAYWTANFLLPYQKLATQTLCKLSLQVTKQ